uniref:Complement C1q subcomponent subunit A-like n=1 Tax=Crassostrea virginica TaxID=6565 RepID=A0A8B8AXK8_CRAVI|nr:complement C1q subcomponent subunit A-like [Crassostrea virginica]
MLTSLKNLVIDNSRFTVTFNSTVLRKLFALSANRPGLQMGAKSVCFSVNLRAKELKLGVGQTVIYDEVLTNEGNGYDDRTGVFTCPVAGNYIFVVDALSPRPVWLHLYLNKAIVASLHVSSNHASGTNLQISRTVILTLKKGDHVKVVNNPTYTGAVYPHGYSGFSGAKLF